MNVVISQVNNVWFVGHNMAQDVLIIIPTMQNLRVVY